MPSGPGVFPLTAVKLHAYSSSLIETGFQSYLKRFWDVFCGIESEGGLGNNVFRRALYFLSKVSFPSIEGIRPYVDGLV
jgi:uncharacterized membrane protein YgaE (UPF0421/DUF939 family)